MEWWESSEFRERGVPFAIDANGVWRDVDAVPRGKACGCVCPDCRGNLIARQGDVRVHHFAHDDRRQCRHALEASLQSILPPALLPVAPLPPGPRAGPAEPTASQPDEFLREIEKKCWCGAAQHEVKLGTGFYAGRRAWRCSANPRHPITLLGA